MGRAPPYMTVRVRTSHRTCRPSGPRICLRRLALFLVERPDSFSRDEHIVLVYLVQGAGCWDSEPPQPTTEPRTPSPRNSPNAGTSRVSRIDLLLRVDRPGKGPAAGSPVGDDVDSARTSAFLPRRSLTNRPEALTMI